MNFLVPRSYASPEVPHASSFIGSKLSKWKLSSRFELELSKDTFADALQKNEVCLAIVLDGEKLAEGSDAVSLVQHLSQPHIHLGPRKTFVANAQGNAKLHVLPKKFDKKLGAHSLGGKYKAFQCGVLVGLALQAEAQAAPKSLCLTLSEGTQEIAQGDLAQFLAGMLQRGVSNGVAKHRDEQSEQRNSFAIKICVGAQHEKWATELEKAKALSNAMSITRTLINLPPNRLNPESYETFVRETVREFCSLHQNPGLISVESWSGEKLLSERCELLYGVGQGSTVPPRLLKLVYNPDPVASPAKHLCLVGKGITFDSGGLDIKASQFMRNMKKDMGGSACAFGAFLAMVSRGSQMRISCYLALAENMVSGCAMRPGDVYFSRKGISVEIDNTDAEGRLVLADALAVACEEKPNLIINLATLTGAARVALGGSVDAMFSNNEALAELAFSSAMESGDLIWELPLFADYKSGLDSSVADLVNSAPGGHGGAITAALFLQRFVGDVPWMHVDTYMWTDKPTDLYAEAGATAKCVRMLDELAKRLENLPSLPSQAQEQV